MESDESKDMAERKNTLQILISELLSGDASELQNKVSKFFDLCIWGEKKCKSLIERIVESEVISVILTKLLDQSRILLQTLTIFLGNCNENSDVLRELLSKNLTDQILQAYILELVHKKEKKVAFD